MTENHDGGIISQMGLIDRYLGLEWIKWFVLALLFLFSVLFIQAFSDDPDSFRYVSQPVGYAYLLNWVLGYFPWVLPISSFLATLVSLGFFSRNCELLALRALGKSSTGLAAPYLLLGLLVSSLCWFSKNWHDRWTNSGPRMSENPALSSFRMKIGQERIWHFTKFDERGLSGEGVHVYAYDGDGSDCYRIRAESASWTEKGWTFENARFLGFPTSRGVPMPREDGMGLEWKTEEVGSGFIVGERASPRLNKNFSRLSLLLQNDDPTTHLTLHKPPEALTYGKLVDLIESYPNPASAKLRPYELRRAHLLWSSPSCLVAVVCALAIGMRSKPTTLGRIAGVSLVGIILFYVVRTFCDALGEKGIVSGWFAVGIPYICVLAACSLQMLRNR